MWIELHQGVFRHRKILSVATALDIQRMSAGGHVISLWLWALDNAPTGDLVGLGDPVIAFGAEWEGDPSKFVSALIDAHLIDDDGGGHRRIHNWHEYAGRLIEKRQKDAERKRVQRMSSGHATDSPRDGAGTVPNLTVPNQLPPLSLPEWLIELQGLPGFETDPSRAIEWLHSKGINEEHAEETALALKAKWGGKGWKNVDPWATFQGWVKRPPLSQNGREHGRQAVASSPTEFGETGWPPGVQILGDEPESGDS